MLVSAVILVALTKAATAAPLNISSTSNLQTGQPATVTGFVPTAVPTLSYYALPGNDTVPYLYGTGLATTTDSAGQPLTTSLNYVVIENVDVFDGDEDTVSTEFIDLDANGNVEDISVCVSLNATAADCAVFIFNATDTYSSDGPDILNIYETTLAVYNVTLTAAPYTALPTSAIPSGLISLLASDTSSDAAPSAGMQTTGSTPLIGLTAGPTSTSST